MKIPAAVEKAIKRKHRKEDAVCKVPTKEKSVIAYKNASERRFLKKGPVDPVVIGEAKDRPVQADTETGKEGIRHSFRDDDQVGSWIICHPHFHISKTCAKKICQKRGDASILSPQRIHDKESVG